MVNMKAQKSISRASRRQRHGSGLITGCIQRVSMLPLERLPAHGEGEKSRWIYFLLGAGRRFRGRTSFRTHAQRVSAG